MTQTRSSGRALHAYLTIFIYETDFKPSQCFV
jgi:hypothetical protein